MVSREARDLSRGKWHRRCFLPSTRHFLKKGTKAGEPIGICRKIFEEECLLEAFSSSSDLRVLFALTLQGSKCGERETS